MKKYICELLGTMVLVLFGCGSAAIAGSTLGTLGIAMAFGLSIVALSYVIGGVSGCHVNPAVSVAMYINGKLSLKDLIYYIVAQVIGAIFACVLLIIIINSSSLGGYLETGLGQNGFGFGISSVGIDMIGAFLVETILTFVFIFTILGVTSNEKMSSVSGIVIGLTLAFVHIMGIPLTGTSVNPARSLAPALFMGGEALSQVWLFILAPLVGAVLAAYAFKYLVKEK